jgi:putative addiction module component (TIGR02574 family)
VGPKATLEAVQSWPVEEQLAFDFQIWDRLVEGGWQPELSEGLRAELDRRLAVYQANPSNVFPWEQLNVHDHR